MTTRQIVEANGVRLECVACGSGHAAVLLANAGCSIEYLEPLAAQLRATGLQSISINMRGVGRSEGSLEGLSLHDLADDVAEVINALGGGAAHIVGHAYGNRIARCLAADYPALVRSVILLGAGGLIGPATPLGTSFRELRLSQLYGAECVTVGKARWLAPVSDLNILKAVVCWPRVHLAHLATNERTPIEDWWTAGIAPVLVVQGLDDLAAPPGNGHALSAQLGERAQVVDVAAAGHFMVLEQPKIVTKAVIDFIEGKAAEHQLLNN